jgi:hypothetical protein
MEGRTVYRVGTNVTCRLLRYRLHVWGLSGSDILYLFFQSEHDCLIKQMEGRS